jgi:hypothetical protein
VEVEGAGRNRKALALVATEHGHFNKLLADRPRDRADIADLLLVAGPLDETYLREWAERLGVSERLEEAGARRRSGKPGRQPN